MIFQKILKFTLRIIKYALIWGIPFAIGCFMATWANELPTHQIAPNHQSEQINWLIVAPMLAVEFAYIPAGFIIGKLYENKKNAI